MCTVAIYAGVWKRFPLLVVANRDEFAGRDWCEPGAHWSQAPTVFAPQDCVSKGSWLGVNGDGLLCTVLNQGRAQSIGRNRLSRGALVISALMAGSLAEARRYAESLDARRYLGFHLVLATADRALVVSSRDGGIVIRDIEPGVHMVSSRGLDADDCPKTARLLQRLRTDIPAQPDANGWQFARQLSNISASPGEKDGFWISLDNGYGTRSSALVAIENTAESAENVGSEASGYVSRRQVPAVDRLSRDGAPLRWIFLHSRPVAMPHPSLPLVDYSVRHRVASVGSDLRRDQIEVFERVSC